MERYTALSGEIIEYPTPGQEVAAFLARVVDASVDPNVSESEIVELIYGKENPLLDQDTLPNQGVVTRETFANPVYHVMSDLLGRKRVQVGTLDMDKARERYTMTVAQAAAELAVHPSAVRQAIAKKRLAAIKQAGQWLLDPNTVENYEVGNRGPRPALRVMTSSRFRVKAPGLEVLMKGGMRGAVQGVVKEFERVAVIWGPKGKYRLYILEPASIDAQIERPGGFVKGRFTVVEKVNNPREASQAFKDFVPA